MLKKILNPFAFMTGRKEHRFYEVKEKPVYENGDYKTYRFDFGWYVTCRGNLIVAETVGIPKGLIEALVTGVEPKGYRGSQYRDTLDAYTYAVEIAKKVGFKLEK